MGLQYYGCKNLAFIKKVSSSAVIELIFASFFENWTYYDYTKVSFTGHLFANRKILPKLAPVALQSSADISSIGDGNLVGDGNLRS